MKGGVSGFQGLRLTEAREARGLSVTGLAEMIGVSRQSVTNYERGAQEPTPETFGHIVDAFGLDSRFFVTSSPLMDDVERPLFYRSRLTTTERALNRAAILLRWQREIAQRLMEYVEFPPLDVPDMNIPSDPAQITDDQIERCAADLRRAWCLGDGPIQNMAWLLENHGAIVGLTDLEESKFDGLSVWPQGDEPAHALLSINGASAVRLRWDAAHELGHCVLHRHLPVARVREKAIYKRLEEQAHRFAGAFLLPAAAFARDVYTVNLNVLVTCKARWRVSIAAMIIRLFQLNIIDRDRQQVMFINLNRRGWRYEEPLDDKLLFEEPMLLQRAVKSILDANLESPESLLDLLPFGEAEVERRVNLEPGFFQRLRSPITTPNPLLRLPQRSGDQGPTHKDGIGGTVVPFPTDTIKRR